MLRLTDHCACSCYLTTPGAPKLLSCLAEPTGMLWLLCLLTAISEPFSAQASCMLDAEAIPVSDRVPDELKRHSLLDKAGSQYSTNLDRNRYGTDNQYLSTVIRYDLDYLGLCPCLVDVEIIDAKNGSGTVIVSAGDHVCCCSGQAKPLVCLSFRSHQTPHILSLRAEPKH